jgi:hypothetical protein
VGCVCTDSWGRRGWGSQTVEAASGKISLPPGVKLPKKPPTSYSLFFQARRGDVVDELRSRDVPLAIDPDDPTRQVSVDASGERGYC